MMKYRKMRAILAGFGLAAVGTISLIHAQGRNESPRQIVDKAAAALGGADRIRALKNLTLIGYAQYAYQNGGGNISALPGAPQKFIAANDYRRIYDLEHGRMLHQERRNDLFPFANYAGHDFALQRQGLDGDLAYNINAQGQAFRAGDARDRRMWMHANPVTAVRAALDPSTTLSNARQENGLSLVDLKLKEGDTLTLAIRPPLNLPEFVRWIAPQINLGEVVVTTRFYGYEPYGGIEPPLGYSSRFDWRPEVEQVKIYVDNYLVDSQIADLTAPAPEPFRVPRKLNVHSGLRPMGHVVADVPILAVGDAADKIIAFVHTAALPMVAARPKTGVEPA